MIGVWLETNRASTCTLWHECRKAGTRAARRARPDGQAALSPEEQVQPDSRSSTMASLAEQCTSAPLMVAQAG